MATARPRTTFPASPAAPRRTSARGITITDRDGRGTWVVALSGEHDLSTVAHLEQYTRDVWAHCKVAVIDLREVTFLDSALIHWLLRVEHALELAECFTLSIVTGPADGAAATLFKRLRMPYVLACYETRREALRQAAARADAFAWPPPAVTGRDTDAERRAA
jgi:anti-anti-sigma regulatory factor